MGGGAFVDDSHISTGGIGRDMGKVKVDMCRSIDHRIVKTAAMFHSLDDRSTTDAKDWDVWEKWLQMNQNTGAPSSSSSSSSLSSSSSSSHVAIVGSTVASTPDKVCLFCVCLSFIVYFVQL